MAENITLRRPKQTYLICILIACFAAAAFFLSPVYGLFFSLFSAVACALLFRLYHPAAAAVAPILSFLIMGALFGFSFDMLLLSFLPSAAGLTMAFCLRRGENRLSTATSVTVSVLVVFLLCATLSLYNAANAAGASDMFVYLSTLLDEVKDAVVAWEMAWLNEIAKWLEVQDLSYALPTEEAIAALISQIMSLIPALFLATVLCLALALTYVVQLLSLLLESRQLFSEKNAVYDLGPLAAAAYLLVSLITLVYTDFFFPLLSCLHQYGLGACPALYLRCFVPCAATDCFYPPYVPQ